MMFGIKKRFYGRHLAEARGYAAGRAGRGFYTNPYPPGTTKRLLWRRAWNQGQYDIYDNYLREQRMYDANKTIDLMFREQTNESPEPPSVLHGLTD